MVDKKRLIIIMSAVAVLAVAITLVIVWLLSAIDAPSKPAGPTPSVQPTETVDPDIAAFTPELAQIARDATHAAVTWGVSTPRDQLINRYTENGMSPEYASVFTPLWVSVFEGARSAQVDVQSVRQPEVLDVTGEENFRTFRVAVPVVWNASWVSSSQGQQNAGTKPGVWILTVDEHTGLITEVDQPTVEDLDLDME